MADVPKLDPTRSFRVPTVEGTCDECGGRIVKHVTGLYRGQYYFGHPECESCGTTYWGATHAAPVGIERFEQMMRAPFTI